MSSSGCMSGSLAALLSAAQGTQLLGKASQGTSLLLSLPALPPAQMGFPVCGYSAAPPGCGPVFLAGLRAPPRFAAGASYRSVRYQ